MGGAVPLGVGIVGLGQGRSHLRAFGLLDGARVVAVCDADAALAERVAREDGVAAHYADYERLLANRAVDLVVVATPDHLHGRQAIMALEAGKHVLSEIPMALTIAECATIVALAARRGLKYHLGNQVRFAPCLHDVQRLIADGAFGEVFYGEGEYLHDMGDIVADRPADHWRIGGEPRQTTLLGGGPHALDTLRWLMGVRFVEAQAYHVAARNAWGALHTTCALLRAANGAVAKITVSYGMRRPYCLYFSVYGSEGSFERARDQGRPTEDTVNYLCHSRLPGARRLIPVTVPNWADPRLIRELGAGLGHGTMEIAQARALLHAIRADREPPLGPREAAASIIPLICALQSADQGGGAVAVPDLTGP